ncbi:alpha/beta hydrolase [Chryseobacterium sp. G0240]|uniref:alpha/beta hydrolase n=1 Tax=Chryseobacterium sp. G0240 TaxID=2487066 RepID=UPI000F4474E3|nr:alpha/beta hydrolase-fold protein [Chryseobacterium sp. G0240]ROI04134.1 alpha/beta hydrolase [Chryseobacterium sp. G0240]
MKIRLLFILSVVVGWLQFHAQTVPSENINIGVKIPLKSENLHEERSIWISLPEGYDEYTKTGYPVIYVLDAENNFKYLSSVYHYLSKEPFGVLPQAILVAIENTNRTRDLTPSKASKEMNFSGKKQTMFAESGGNAMFMKFIKDELFPFIEKKYRSNGYKVLVGHSFGGLTVINNLLSEPMFNAYIANDPSLWWDKELMIRKAENSSKDFKDIKLFLAQANNADSRNVKDDEHEIAIGKFKTLLEQHKLKNLQWQYGFYENDDHGTVPLLGNNDGLRFIFKSNKWNFREALKNPALISSHYQELSDSLNHSFKPTELFFKKIIDIARERGTPDSVKEFEKLQKQYYP